MFIGARIASTHDLGDGWRARPMASIAWVHEFSSNRSVAASFASAPGFSFLASGPRSSADEARLTAGLDLTNRNGLNLFAEFQADVSRSARSYGGKGGVRFTW